MSTVDLAQGGHGGHGGGGHEAHAAASGWLPPVLAVALVAAGYLVLALRQHRDARGWSRWRTASFLAGAVLLALAVLPQASPYPPDDFRGHMLQHLLIGMVAPMGLALGAPVTLLLRAVPTRWGRVVGRVLRSGPAHVLAHPATILGLNLGGLVALYATPLHAVAAGDGLTHHLVHLHFLLSGYLFAWVIAGPDPAPRRPSVRTRLVLLGIAVAVHAVLSQLMYAGVLGIRVPVEQLRGAAELMYYGGDIAELLLAFALVSSWRTAQRTAASNTDTLASATNPDSSPSSPR
ncbi:cytochrome C oxidase assembly protein [Actinophytocola xanthii]|uniref:Cytochrome C oxidase assembly protein n=1 Tax=Actinophytocola xanthii TaxID=1912961 RepID=A0A1Q8CPQ2_9PSEU|nr:cytochrome C oxidase assembly protein [Actinophytocola xanthii]